MSQKQKVLVTRDQKGERQVRVEGIQRLNSQYQIQSHEYKHHSTGGWWLQFTVVYYIEVCSFGGGRSNWCSTTELYPQALLYTCVAHPCVQSPGQAVKYSSFITLHLTFALRQSLSLIQKLNILARLSGHQALICLSPLSVLGLQAHSAMASFHGCRDLNPGPRACRQTPLTQSHLQTISPNPYYIVYKGKERHLRVTRTKKCQMFKEMKMCQEW